jgi:exodeoxyribonuclease VII small subunit
LAGLGYGLRCAVEAATKIALMTASDTTARSARKSASSQLVAASYEEALQELETLMARIEGGQLPLDQLLGQYQRATALLGYCREQLQAVEQQIKVLDGETLKPWDGA